MTDADVPEGFAPHLRKSNLTAPWEPLYSKIAEGAVVIGLRAAECHTNSRGFVHGGLIATLADNAMGLSCLQAKAGGAGSLVTVTLNIDFLASVGLGQWLEIRPQVIKVGRQLAFASALVVADGKICARANATFQAVGG